MFKNLMVLWLILSFADCKPRQPPQNSGIDALPQSRAILGPAKPWTALLIDPKRVNESIFERRRAAWETVERALTRVDIVNPKTGRPFVDANTGQTLTLPLWQTWYEANEFRTMMFQLWSQLTPAQRIARESSVPLVDEVMNNHHLNTLLKKWTTPGPSGETKFEKLLAEITADKELAALNGVSGSGYTLFSPAMIRHYLLHYGDVFACTGTPPEFSTGNPTKDLATCLGDAFPPGAVAVKTTWSNANEKVGVFNTTARGLANVLSMEKPTWRTEDSTNLTTHSPSEIYTSSTFENEKLSKTFVLTGLHFLTKDIPEWMWISLWWSPDSDTDFGEDRPTSISTLGPKNALAVWSHYKMCVASTFDEQDLTTINNNHAVTTAALLASTDSSLKAALASSYHFSAPHTFCSNPFLEFGEGLANTNCIGCHQHSGPINSGAKVDAGRKRVRTSFMTDFTWSFDSPMESFRSSIKDVVTQ